MQFPVLCQSEMDARFWNLTECFATENRNTCSYWLGGIPMHLIRSVVLIKILRATTEKYCALCALVKDITAYKDTANTLCALENHSTIVLLATEI